MAKPVLKFTAVSYEIGNHTGYRPQLEQQKPVSDLDFCREVVTEKRLSMSAEELLHALEMVGEVGPQKVAEDGEKPDTAWLEMENGETDWQPCEATVTKAEDELIRLTLAQSGGGMMAEKLRFTVTTPGGSAVKVLESFT